MLNLNNLDELIDYGGEVNCILQLRLHPAIRAIQVKQKSVVNLIYHVKRGKWYQQSWKGDPAKSGGICTNIGIHFFDLLTHLFGKWTAMGSEVGTEQAKGYIMFGETMVNWELRTDAEKPCRWLTIDGEEVAFTKGFEDLHTESYRRILCGVGFTLQDARPSIELVNQILCAE